MTILDVGVDIPGVLQSVVLLGNVPEEEAAPGPAGDALLKEDGDYLLLETGDYLLLE